MIEVLTLARLSDNQLHYVHTGKAWIHSSNIKITELVLNTQPSCRLRVENEIPNSWLGSESCNDFDL